MASWEIPELNGGFGGKNMKQHQSNGGWTNPDHELGWYHAHYFVRNYLWKLILYIYISLLPYQWSWGKILGLHYLGVQGESRNRAIPGLLMPGYYAERCCLPRQWHSRSRIRCGEACIASSANESTRSINWKKVEIWYHGSWVYIYIK